MYVKANGMLILSSSAITSIITAAAFSTTTSIEKTVRRLIGSTAAAAAATTTSTTKSVCVCVRPSVRLFVRVCVWPLTTIAHLCGNLCVNCARRTQLSRLFVCALHAAGHRCHSLLRRPFR